MTSVSKTPKLEASPMWKEANYLAEYVYGKLGDFPEEEKWNLVVKLRNAACDLIFYVAQAVGDASPAPTDYDLGNAHKYVASLKTMYRFAGRQKYVELEPEIMVRFDRLLTLIDKALVENHKKTEQATEDEMKPWLKKYEIWKQISKESHHEN